MSAPTLMCVHVSFLWLSAPALMCACDSICSLCIYVCMYACVCVCVCGHACVRVRICVLACLHGLKHVDLCNQSCSFSWLAVLCELTSRWTLRADLSTKFFRTCHAYKHYELLPFYTTLRDLDIAGGHKVSTKSGKPVGFILSHTFLLVRMKYNIVLKRFFLNILIPIWREIYIIKWNNCCFIDCKKI